MRLFSSLTCRPPLPSFLMLMSLPYGTGDCTLSAPRQVWIWGTEPYVRVQCYIVFIFGLQHMNVKRYNTKTDVDQTYIYITVVQ